MNKIIINSHLLEGRIAQKMQDRKCRIEKWWTKQQGLKIYFLVSH